MATRFADNPKIVAGMAPFRAVWRDSLSSGAKLGQQMGKFVEERGIDLWLPVPPEQGIQSD
jgi:hypothetical protein